MRRAHRTRTQIIAVLWCSVTPALASLAAQAHAQHTLRHDRGVDVARDAAPAAGRRDGHPIVRVTVASQRQLEDILALGAVPLNCVIAPGVQEFCVSPATLQHMRGMSLNVAILHTDAQALIDAERARLFAPGNQNANFNFGDEGGIAGGLAGPGTWFDEYKTLPQIDAYLDSLAALRPDLASIITVGTSIEGRTIRALRITSPVGANKPAVIFNGCQHAREWIATMVPTFIADTLVRDYGSDPRITALLDSTEFYIVPVANPDGFEFTYAPEPVGYRMWRKNRRDSGGGNFGVDLNRNWGVDWGGPHSTSTNPASDSYIGTSAFSEPETAALRDFMLARPNLVAHIDFHSYGQLVLHTWGHTNTENADYDVISRAATAANLDIAGVHNSFYQNGWGGSLLYLVSGVMRDWTYGDRGMLSYTIELRDRGADGFLLPAAQIVPTCEEALQGALALAECATGGAEFFFPRGLPQAIVADSTTTLRVDIHPTPQATLQPATAAVKWRIGSSGAFASSPMTALGGVQHQATLPALACGQRLEFFFEIENAAGVPLRSPDGAPDTLVHVAIAARNLLVYNFESSTGWSTSVSGATAGLWQRGVPVNDPDWPYDPRQDADGIGGGGAGACYLTGNALGASDLDNGSVLLTSQSINASALLAPGEQPSIAYAWYLRTVSPVSGDLLRADLSVNGVLGPYTALNTHTGSGTTWSRSRVPDPGAGGPLVLSSSVSLRFVAADGDPQSIVEAGVDDVRIMGDCGVATCPGDVDHSGAVDVDDLIAVILSWGACGPPGPPCPTDIAPAGGNGQVDVDDLIAVILGWGACE